MGVFCEFKILYTLNIKQYNNILCNNELAVSFHMIREIIIHKTNITLTSWLQKLVEEFIQDNNKENIKTPRYWPFAMTNNQNSID